LATKKEEKEFEKERKKYMKERMKRMKEDGLEKYFTPDQIRYNRNQRIVGAVWSWICYHVSSAVYDFNSIQT
jgi:multiple sugar transport system permease protein